MKSIKKDSSKNLKNTTSTPEINSFFKTAPKLFVVNDKPKNNHEETSSRDFYIQTLKERLQGKNNDTRKDEAHEGLSQENGLEDFGQLDGACAVVVEKSAQHVENIVEKDRNIAKVSCPDCELNQKKSKEWEEKYKELKKTYYKLAVHHSELDLKHKDLKEVAATKTNQNNVDTNATSDAADGDIFTANELKFLQCMSLEKQKDSTFVLQCLKFAYKQETSVLNNKSLFGTKGRIEFTEDGNEVHQPAKQPLSPHKVDRIRGVFIDRISKCVINSVEYGVRIKATYLNQLFASAIKNISKKRDSD